MNPDLAGLLGALRERPDDKEVYLVLADWCLEQPDDATHARGEYIQMSLALSDHPRTKPAARELRERMKAIEKRFRTAWLGTLREFGHRCDFLPGGLVKVEVTGGRATHARKTKVISPKDEEFVWVSSLIARSASLQDMRWLARILPMGCVRFFQVEVASAEGLVEVLSRSQWMRGVRKLNLYSHSIRLADDEAVRLAGLSCLSDLCELSLRNADLRAEGCSTLGNSPHLRQLRELGLPSCGLAMPALRSLLSTAFAPPLTVLSLEGNEISCSATEILAGWPALANVRKLSLDGNPLGDDGLAALAQSPHLGKLRELSVKRCGLTTRGLKALARAPLGQLKSLDICANDGIGDAGLVALCDSSSLSSLRKLMHGRYGMHGIRQRTLVALNARFGAGHNPHT